MCYYLLGPPFPRLEEPKLFLLFIEAPIDCTTIAANYSNQVNLEQKQKVIFQFGKREDAFLKNKVFVGCTLIQKIFQ